MKDYIHFSANDFVMDEFFQSWVWNPDEKSNTFWRSWLAVHPHKAAEVEEARHILQHLKFPGYKLPEDEVGALWKRIRGLDIPTATKRKNISKPWWQLAAAAVVVFGLAFFFLLPENDTVTYTTAYGETKHITLPDYSIVVLNANSKLSFEDNWDQASVREIMLEGEAYFDVQHKKNNQPFKVIMDDGVAVEVLGTTFNVYHRIQQTKVVLNSGKISLSLPTEKASEKIIMNPGELVEFETNQYTKKKVNPQRYVAWTQQRLILDRTSLREMVQMLRDTYGVYVEVKPASLLDETVSGSMPAADKEELVQQIAKAFRLTATEHDGKIIMAE